MHIFGETTPKSVVTLPRYAQLVGYSECAFFGISHVSNPNYACREIWTKWQRDDITMYLEEAQKAIEDVVGYPLQPTWISDERQPINRIIMARWGHVIEAGVRAESVLSDNVINDIGALGADPDTVKVSFVSPVPISDLTEVHVFYPGTDMEIIPSDITYVALTGVLEIFIPRCRLLKYTLLDNPDSGYVYTDDANFQTTVDVHRIYNDTSIQAKLIYKGDICSSFCVEDYDNTCIYIDQADIGKLRIQTGSAGTCRAYTHVELNYRAGMTELTRRMESIIIRLAHSMMPTEPCGCEVTQRLWRRDRDIPKILTRERIDCPFGMSDGAWVAWKWACGLQLHRMTTLVGKFSL